MTLKRFLIAAAAIIAAATTAGAEQRSLWPSEYFKPQTSRNTAGEFDYYALVLSWSPTYCAGAGDRDGMQCDRSDGRRFAFVLHGLWPQYTKGYPENCMTRRKPFVPQASIDRMLDIMPSPRLVIHEYRKHGTCSGLSPDAYLGLSRKLFESVRIPPRYVNPFEMQFVSPDDMIQDFTSANPKIKPDMMAVACGGAGNRLKEIRICFSKEGQPQSCGENESQRRLCSTQRMMVPPVRSTARSDAMPNIGPRTPSSSYQSNQIPRPRLIEGPNGED